MRPLIRLNYGAAIDLPMALIAESTLGAGSQVRDSNGRLWTSMNGRWHHGRMTLPNLADVVQVHGDVIVVRILGSELV